MCKICYDRPYYEEVQLYFHAKKILDNVGLPVFIILHHLGIDKTSNSQKKNNQLSAANYGMSFEYFKENKLPVHYNRITFTAMAECKTAVSPVLTCLRYCSLALNH